MLSILLGALAVAAQEPAQMSDPAIELEQSVALEQTVAVEEAARPEVAVNLAASPPDSPLSLLSGIDVSLAISENESTTTLRYAWQQEGRRMTSDGMGQRFTRSVFDVGVTLPIGGADNLLDSETYDAFTRGPAIDAGFTWFGFTSRASQRFDSPALGRMMEDAIANCLRNPGEGRDAEYCEAHRGYRKVRFARDYVSSARVLRAVSTPAFGFSLDAKLGFDIFDYRTPLTLAKNRQTKPNFSGTGTLLFFPADARSLFSISLAYENAFEARDAEIMCQPVVADPNEDCVLAAPGLPRNVERLPLGVEYRRNIGTISGAFRIGIAPQASYDLIGDHYRLELPIYFAPVRESAFVPGLSLSYDSGDDDFVVGLFLRRSFGLGR